MRRSLAALGLLLALGAADARAVQKPSPRDRVRPDFDSRVGRGPAVAPLFGQAISERLDLLRERLGSPLRTRTHPVTGSVRLIWAGGEALSDAGADPVLTTRRFLQENAALLGLDPAGALGLVPTIDDAPVGSALRRVLLQQVVDGMPVFGGVVAVHLDRMGRVVKVAAGPLHRGRGPEAPAPTPALPAEDAFMRAVADVRPELKLAPRRRAGTPSRSRTVVFEAGPLRSEADAELVWFPTADGDRLAWKVTVDPGGFPQVYDILVDAENGAVLYRRNRVRYADGVGTVPQTDETALQDPRRPDEHPVGSDPAGPIDPPGGCPPVAGYTSRSLNTPFRDPATVLSAGGRLSGNNGSVYRTTPGVFGALGTLGSGTWQFDYPFGSASSVETALFFSTNYAHDFFYDLGFDEAAANLQVSNFGRGGVGGDGLRTLARADGRNNATFEPAPEGQSPTMSLFLFDGAGCWAADLDGDGGPDLDGGYDRDVVIHEYHHGVSLRLNPDFTGPEADAMGEGGGDFFAYSISGNTQLAEYSVPPFGIREVNAKTYADWSCFFFFCEPHDNGEIWANVLWDLREGFRTDLVGGSDAAAIDEVHRLYVDGLKLSPPSPTMLDLRDAMVQADLLRNPDASPGGSQSYCRIWTAFAGRGMGQGALDTQDTGDNTVVPDDELPAACPQPIRVTLVVADDQAAEAGLDPASFVVTRSGDASSDLAVSYTVSGTATAGADYQALTGTLTIPAGSQAATIEVSPVDDGQYEALETVVVTLSADPAYVLQGAPSGTVRITSDDAGPDLAVSALTVPTASSPGQDISVTDTTKNQGAGVAAPSTTSFYLSANTLVDGSDVLLGSRPVAELLPNNTSVVSTTLTIPADTNAGSYYVIARADSASLVFETNENNNTRAVLVAVGPDLVVSALTAPSAAGAGQALSVTDTTKNQGAGLAPPTTTSFYLSPNAVFDAADVFLGSRPVPELLPNASSAVSTSLTIPAGTSGNYYVIARADNLGLVSETSETNNTRVVLVAVGPDLVVSALTAPSASGAGQTLSVTDTTRNQGAGLAPPTTTSFYLSPNAVFDAADVLLGSRPVPELLPNATSAVSTSLTIPAGTSAGNHYVIARADNLGLVSETSETNNTRVALVAVGPDLVVSALTAPASAPGATLSVTDTTKNQGAGVAPPTTTSFYLSVNAALDASDTFLGSRPVPALLQNAASVVSTSLTIPADTHAGSYYVIATADSGSLVSETSEGNNTRTVLVAVGPDLVVSALTAPSASGAGQTLSVTDTTRNQGAGLAPPTTTSFYLSPNAVFDAADVFLGSRPVPELLPNSTSVVSTPLTIPAGTSAGSYYVIARADGDTLVPETSESNNTRVALVAVGPDLVVSALTAPPAVGAGQALSVTDTTKNQGAGLAPPTTTAFYLSSNAVLDAADVFLGSRPVPELLPNASSAVSTPLTIPAGTSAGNHYVIARADSDPLVPETNENNNNRTVLVVVGPP